MNTRTVVAVFAFIGGAAGGQAADIRGTVVIQRKLTKRTITVAASSYQRSGAVDLAYDAREDALGFERSHVAVYIEGSHLPSTPVNAAMEQRNRRFFPDLVVIPAGSTLSFPNRDTIFHNVFSLSSSKIFDLGTYPKDDTRVVTFSKPGVIFVNCHLHPNMGAAIVVTPNQWATRADESGSFVLPSLPPGKYTVVAWHKSAGYFRQTVEVNPGQDSTTQFFLPLDERAIPALK